MPAIEVGGLRKWFGETLALNDVSFDVAEGEVMSLLGPSGCGKTTTLRSIAGLEVPDEGVIRIFDTEVVSKGKSVPPEERGLSMVFQQYALWPHLDVRGNVMFGPLMRGESKAEAAERAKRALQMVKLWQHRDRRISQLSGGQQQRVALARALALESKVMLLDEPLSNLDAKLREETKIELMELQRELGFTAIYVTHDQSEALSLSDRIVILNEGSVEQIGAPEEIWSAPATEFVAEFIGDSNSFEGVIEAADGYGGGPVLHTPEGNRLMLSPNAPFAPGESVRAFMAFEDVVVQQASDATDEPNVLSGRIRLTSFQGSSSLVKVDIGTSVVTARVPTRDRLGEGAQVQVRLAPDRFKCFRRGLAAAVPAAATVG